MKFGIKLVLLQRKENKMRIRDLPLEEIQVGMRILGLKTRTSGTIVRIDPNDDFYCWVQFDNESGTAGGWYGNDCNCEVVLDEKTGKPVIALWECKNGHRNFGPKNDHCPHCPSEKGAKVKAKNSWTTDYGTIQRA
jgi:hypothetical protein